MKKILLFFILTLSVFSQENVDNFKLFEEKKYNEIIKAYNNDDINVYEFNVILAKIVSEKNIQAIKELKIMNGFKERFINYLLFLDNIELLNYYQKNTVFEKDTFTYEKLVFDALRMDSTNILNELIKNKKEINISEGGMTLLQEAYFTGSFKAFKIILDKTEKMENFNITNEYFLMGQEGREISEKLEALLKYDENKKKLSNKIIEEIYYYYARNGEVNKAVEIEEKHKEIKVDPEEKSRLIILAGIKKDYKLVEKLIKNGMEILVYDYDDKEVCAEFLADDTIEKLLTENNVDTGILAIEAIVTLISSNRLDEAEKLLNRKYKINKEDLAKSLIYIATSTRNMEALKLIKKHNLLINNLDTEYIDYVIEENNKETFEYLLNNLENPKILYDIDRLVEYSNIDMLKILINKEKDGIKKKEIKQKIFYSSLVYENEKIINFLLDSGFDINEMNVYGKTQLYYAIRIAFEKNGYDNTGIFKIIKLFKDKGADFNKIDNKKSALIFAIEKSSDGYNENTDLVDYLLSLNVDINYRDERGYTAYDYVKQLNNKELDEMFKKYNK